MWMEVTTFSTFVHSATIDLEKAYWRIRSVSPQGRRQVVVSAQAFGKDAAETEEAICDQLAALRAIPAKAMLIEALMDGSSVVWKPVSVKWESEDDSSTTEQKADMAKYGHALANKAAADALVKTNEMLRGMVQHSDMRRETAQGQILEAVVTVARIEERLSATDDANKAKLLGEFFKSTGPVWQVAAAEMSRELAKRRTKEGHDDSVDWELPKKASAAATASLIHLIDTVDSAEAFQAGIAPILVRLFGVTNTTKIAAAIQAKAGA